MPITYWQALPALMAIRDKGNCLEGGFLAAHKDLHSWDWKLDPKDWDLDCEFCCRVPPWDWREISVHHVLCVPIKPGNRPYFGKPRTREDPKRASDRYLITYEMENQRTPRFWAFTQHLYGECRDCGQWARIANHKLFSVHPSGSWYPQWEDLHICLTCAKKDSKRLKKLTPRQYIQEIKKASNLTRKGRKHERSA